MWTELAPLLHDYGMPGLIVALVVLGWLVPKRTHERELADKDKQIDRLLAAHDKVVQQRDDLLELAQVTVGIVAAIPRAKEPL